MGIIKQFILLTGFSLFGLTGQSQINYTWNGTLSTDWNTAGNWTPNGIPGAADNVTIVTGSNTCLVGTTVSIANFKLTSGTLDLGGSTFTVSGATVTFTAGTVQNGVVNIPAATTTSFGNGPVTMNCPVNITSSSVTMKNTTFQEPLTVTKTGSSNDGSGGGNVFNDVTTMTNAGSGYLLLANGQPDAFNAPVTFNNTGSSSLYVAYNSSNNVFGGVVTFNNNPSANTLIYVGQNSAGTVFNDNIIVSSSGGQGVQFCGATAASATLAAGKTITTGAGGFTAGTLLLRQFTQMGATAQNIVVTGAGNLTFGPQATFGGDVTASSPTLFLNGCTFNGATDITKTGSTGDWSNGGNTFNGVSSITNSGTSYFLLGNNNPDTWNNDVTFTDNGSERLLPCWSSTGNQFNGNIYVNTAGSAQGIQFCGGNTTATATLAATKTIQAGTGGLTAGYLYLKQFTQTGSTPVNLTGTGTTAIYLGPNSNFGGVFTATAPDIWVQGATYSSPATFTKTGGSSNHNNQNQNIFNSTCTINQQSNTGYFMLGYNSNDQFNDNVIVTSSGTGGIYLGWTSGTGTPTMAAGKTILVGAAGFSAGFLYLNTFTQLGNTPINLDFTGTNTYLAFARNSVIGGDLTTHTPDLYFNGVTFNGVVDATKTGAGGDVSGGGNVFQGSATLSNSGTGYLILGSGNPDTFNSDATFNSSGSSYVALGWNSTGNQFNGNITVSSTGSSTGIQFCPNGTTTTASQAAGMTFQTGAAGFSSGLLYLRHFTQLGNSPINLNMTGTTTLLQVGPSSSFSGAFTAVSPRILLNGAVYNDIVNVTKTGATGEWSAGGNIFNSTMTINHQGGGYFGFANGAPDIFNGDVYVNNNSTERVIFGNTPTGNQFNGNIILTQVGSSVGIAFGWSSSTDVTLAAGKTISIGAAGFSTGYLQIQRFTQLGNAPMNLNLTGTNTLLQVGPTCSFGGDFTAVSPRIQLNGAVYNGMVDLTKTGVTGEWSYGGNVFNSTTTINQQGGGFFGFGSGAPDIFNGDVYVNNNSTERVIFGNTPTGNQFNGNIILTQVGSSQGIAFGWSSSTDIKQAAGKTISIGAAGFNTGFLQIERFTQLGNAPMSLPLTGNSSLTFGPNAVIGGDLTSTSGSLNFNGCIFGGIANCTKTGATNDNSSGNNIFNGAATMTNAGSGYLLFGNGNADQFNAAATFNNTGSSNIYVAYNSPNNIFRGVTTFNNTPTANTLIYVSQNSAGTLFGDNIIVSSTNGQGVQFCGGTSASAQLSTIGSIIIGPGGFSAGTLLLRQFTQLGSTPQSLTLTGTGNLVFGPSSAFGGNVTSTSPTLFFNGCNFKGTVTAVKNGATSDASSGNNTFNGPFSITNTGAGYFLMGNGNPDLWQSTATFNNQSTAQHMYVAYNSTGNTFNDDVAFNNQPGATGLWIYPNNAGINTQFNGNITVTNLNGGGVYFGNGSGTATLAAGRTISAGAAGFNLGGLILRNFAQSGGAAQTLTTTGTSYIQYGPGASFGGSVTSSSPGLLFNGSVFSSPVNATKTGTSSDASVGGNTFNSSAVFTNNGTGYLMMTNNTADAYNSDVSFVQSTTGTIYPNYNNSSAYAGSLTVTSPSASAITFGAGNGTATLSGGALQNINAGGGTPTPVFTRLVIANAAGVTLNTTSINVSKSLTMTSGLLNTTTTRILTMLSGSVTASGDALSTSFVNGPMRYQKSGSGATTMNFPIGNGPDCRPIVLTVSHSNGTLYTYQAQLFDASALALGYTFPPSVDHVSDIHYYTIGRTDASGTNQPVAGLSGNQTIQIYFGANDVVSNGGTLTVVKNVYTAPTAWIDIGGMGGPVYNAGANLTGSITSTSGPSAFNSFSTFALGDKSLGGNVLPIELLDFYARANNGSGGVDLGWTTTTESNNSYFTIERSADAVNFTFVQKVATAAIGGNSSVALNYTGYDANPYSGISYYRLKQTDLDGKEHYSAIQSVNLVKKDPLSIYPNPTRGPITITGIGADQTTVKVEWFDAGGRLVWQETLSAQNGKAVSNTRLNSGMYGVRIQAPNGTSWFQSVLVLK
jgi:hypothetical protein